MPVTPDGLNCDEQPVAANRAEGELGKAKFRAGGSNVRWAKRLYGFRALRHYGSVSSLDGDSSGFCRSYFMKQIRVP